MNPNQQCETGTRRLERYKHTPLESASKQIRLLKVTREDLDIKDSPIHLSLQTYDLDDAPNYHALSYVWGCDDAETDITVDNRRFQIRCNLGHFFKRLANGDITSGHQLLLQECARKVRNEFEEFGLSKEYWLCFSSDEEIEFLDKHLKSTANKFDCSLGDKLHDWHKHPQDVLDMFSVRLQDRKVAQYLFENKLHLWIDQLCIDQSNLNERAQQVQVMGSIFAGARSVVAWLGESIQPTPTSSAMSNESAFEISQKHSRMLRSSYWTRLWVVQEFRLATRLSLHMEDFCMPLPGERDILSSFASPGLREAGSISLSNALIPFLDTPFAGKLTLELCASCTLQCSDPRDRVFALLGVCKSTIPIDYTTPANKLFWLAIEECAAVLQKEELDLRTLFIRKYSQDLPYVGIRMGVTGREDSVHLPRVQEVCETLWPGQKLEWVFSEANPTVQRHIEAACKGNIL